MAKKTEEKFDELIKFWGKEHPIIKKAETPVTIDSYYSDMGRRKKLIEAGFEQVEIKKYKFAEIKKKMKEFKAGKAPPPTEVTPKEKAAITPSIIEPKKPGIPTPPPTAPKESISPTLTIQAPSFDPELHIPKDDDPEIVGFVNRVEYFNKLESFRKIKQSVMLIGETGVGKTVIAKRFAWKLKFPFLAISADNMLSIRDLFGTFQIAGATSFFVEGIFVKMIQVPSIILIDEVTALDPAKNFAFHQILASRQFFSKDANLGRGVTYNLHPDCFLMFAGNPPSLRYVGLNKFNIAFVDRVGTILVEPLSRKELVTIFKGRMPSAELDRLLDYYDEIRKLITTQNLRCEFSLRSLNRIIGLKQEGFEMRTAIDLGFLNGITAFEKKAGEAIKSLTLGYYK